MQMIMYKNVIESELAGARASYFSYFKMTTPRDAKPYFSSGTITSDSYKYYYTTQI